MPRLTLGSSLVNACPRCQTRWRSLRLANTTLVYVALCLRTRMQVSQEVVRHVLLRRRTAKKLQFRMIFTRAAKAEAIELWKNSKHSRRKSGAAFRFRKCEIGRASCRERG